MSGGENAAAVVAGALAGRAPCERGRFLRELLAHTAAGLVVIEGESAASEAVYRLADAVVARGAQALRTYKAKDPALKAQRAARDRLLRLERQAQARADAVAVADGVAETVALSRARGAAIVGPEPGRRGPRAQPYRRLNGLDWLAGKDRITPQAKAAGERYGWAYRRVKLEKAIPSTLDDRIRGEFVAPSLEETLARGEGTELARRKLAEFRARLSGQPDLVAACDIVCGEEKTPREAAGGERDAARLEAVLKVALDLLAAG